MKSTVTSKGQVTIPSRIRSRAHIVPGTQLDFQIKDDNTIVIHLLSRDISDLRGIVKIKPKKPVSLADMKSAIQAGAAKIK